MKKILQSAKLLSKAEQKKIAGGYMDVNCRTSGECTCPDGTTKYRPEANCESCVDTDNGGFTCTRGDYSFNVDCASEQNTYCAPLA